jgi:hypothetical protein
MYLFRNNKYYLSKVTNDIEDYFKEIGFLEQFIQYVDKYNVIKGLFDYERKDGLDDKFHLKKIEERLLEMKYDELEQFLQFLLNEEDYFYLEYRGK